MKDFGCSVVCFYAIVCSLSRSKYATNELGLIDFSFWKKKDGVRKVQKGISL